MIAACAAGSCASSKKPRAAAPTVVEPVAKESGTAEAAPVTAGEDESQRRLTLMEQALKHRAAGVDTPAQRADPDEAAGGPVEVSAESNVAPAETTDVAIGAAPAVASKQELVAELARQIREQAKGSSAPAAALLHLSALGLIEPGATGNETLSEDSLTPGEIDFLRASRELFDAARDGLNSSGDIGPLASRIADLAERMQASQPLAVIESRLCMRVDGYGMFSEMPRTAPDKPYVLTAGTRARAIVYIELSNYTHSPAKARGVEGFEVRLSQDLTLYHAGSEGDTVVWRRPFKDIDDFSRKRRRDFYTTQVIELPATLGVGAYRLKVTVSDKASAAVAEAIVPIEFVAEATKKR